MRIAHLIVSLNRGGQERVVVDLATEQINTGNDVSIICLNEEGSLAEEASKKGIKIFNCKKNSAFDFIALKKLRILLKNNDIQILHTHNAVANYYGVAAKIGSGLSCIINTRHGNGPTQGTKVEKIFLLSMYFTDHCICVSESARKMFIKKKILSKNNSSVIFNGINLGHYSPIDELKHKLRNDFGFHEKIIIGTVGRLAKAKDIPLLINAFSKLKNKYDARLVIIGNGPERNKIEREIDNLNLRDHVSLLGDRSDARYIMQAFDIYAVSSQTEGFSIAILEACAGRLPVVATNVGGNSEIIVNNLNGSVVEHGNADDLSDAIEALINNPKNASKYAKNAYNWVAQNCTVTQMSKSYKILYEKFL